jgi:Uma2 family endonuclease
MVGRNAHSRWTMAVEVLRRRFSIEEYHRMGRAGILSEDDRVELIEGEIVVMTPIGSAHAGKLNRLGRLFTVRLGQRAIVAIQNPIALLADSEPQPDLAILRPRVDFYERSHPRPEDVLLLVEIAETSLDYDRTVKVPLYARAGLPEVWIVDLAAESIEVYQEPSEGSYRGVQFFIRGQSLAPQALPDLLVPADEIFG